MAQKKNLDFEQKIPSYWGIRELRVSYIIIPIWPPNNHECFIALASIFKNPGKMTKSHTNLETKPNH